MPVPTFQRNQRIHRRIIVSPPPSDQHDELDSDSDTILPASSINASDEPAPKRPRLVSESLLTEGARIKAIQPKDATMIRILQLAQFIKRGVDLWVNILEAVKVGKANEILERYEDMEPSDGKYNKEDAHDAKQILKKYSKDKGALVKAYKGIMSLFSEHKRYIDDLGYEKSKEMWRKVNSAAIQARSNDARNLKLIAHKYVLLTGQPNPPIDDTKANRGTSHPDLLPMIIPMSLLYKHGNDEDFVASVKAKKYRIDHRSAPAFLYENVDSWNPQNADEGFLKGYYVVRVFRHLFTCPSSAMAEPGKRGKKTRPGNASIAGQSEVTPEMIAYACVHARFFISKLETFTEIDEDFNMKKFYYGIVNLLANKESEWVKDTLTWWNEQVFGGAAEDENSDKDSDEDENDESSFANLGLHKCSQS